MNTVKRYCVEATGLGLHLEGHAVGTIERVVVQASDFDTALAREAALREELADETRRANVNALNARHAKQDLNSIQQRLTVAEQRSGEMANAFARIHGRAEMFIDDGMHMPTPSIEAIRDIAAKAALKPATEAESARDQGIPGTSFQRLNQLANEGE